jgi:ubiquinone/menaquinone biosynthesis C-methylase UbiE
MIAVSSETHLAGAAFDTVAAFYDSTFTTSLIGRAQRSAVWAKAAQVFRAGDHVLELNCGTGEDALFLARRGIAVTACDASTRMIEQARFRTANELSAAPIEFRTLCTEELDQLDHDLLFDGVFSNFSGLNCVSDIHQAAQLISHRLKSGAQLLLCLSTRFCLWEIFYYTLRGNLRKAFRRCSGVTAAQLGPHSFPVYYLTLNSLLQSLGPEFRFLSVKGIGISVPPSYLEKWARGHTRMIDFFESIDKIIGGWPGFRVVGDHMLVHLERV